MEAQARQARDQAVAAAGVSRGYAVSSDFLHAAAFADAGSRLAVDCIGTAIGRCTG